MTQPQHSKLKHLLTNKNMLFVLAMGFASGLPLLLTGGTLQAWASDSKVSLSNIGLFALIGLPYSWKFLWAPILDRYKIPFFGRRRGWLLIWQALLALALVGMAFSNPAEGLTGIAIFALLVAFASASQDSVVDAYRLEVLPREEFGFGTSLYATGYRLAMLLASAGALTMADHYSWRTVYLVMAGIMILAMLISLAAPEPKLQQAPPLSLKEAVWDPIAEFFKRPGIWWVLAFVVLYKAGDNFANSLTTKYYLDLTYTKTQIGIIGKTAGLTGLIIGGLAGGMTVVYVGIYRSLWVCGILQAFANLVYILPGYVLSSTGQASWWALASSVFVENFMYSLGTAAFMTFVGSLINKKFTATQYALLTGLASLARTLGSAPLGYVVTNIGWNNFYICCSVAAIPGLLLIVKMKPLVPGTISGRAAS